MFVCFGQNENGLVNSIEYLDILDQNSTFTLLPLKNEAMNQLIYKPKLIMCKLAENEKNSKILLIGGNEY